MPKLINKSEINVKQLSKKLAWLLRHGANKVGIPIRADGYVQVQDILKHPSYKQHYTLEILQYLVENDEKKRYSIRENPSNNMYEIKANHGHSMNEVKSDLCLRKIFNKDEIPMAVHGTYYCYWPSIKQRGLSRMSRTHIHFAIADTKCGVISGFRQDCEILIYLDVAKVLNASDMQLYRSDNDVVLCSGLEESGCIPSTFFAKVSDRRSDMNLLAKSSTSSSLLDNKCPVCCKQFHTVQECLKHDLLEHSKKSKSLKKRCQVAWKFLNSSKTLEERDVIHKVLQNCTSGTELENIFKILCMNHDNLQLLFTRVQTCLGLELRSLGLIKIYSFGSIGSKLALKDCDIDVYMDASNISLTADKNKTLCKQNGNDDDDGEDTQSFYPGTKLHKLTFNRINRMLHRSKHFHEVYAIRGARVPIIKCKHKETGFSIDINLSCPNSVENTRFLQSLVDSDKRIHELLLFLKIWAKHMQIVNRNNMTSYCLVVLVIFYLQQPLEQLNHPPVLLSIQKLQENCTPRLVQGINYAYNLEHNEKKPNLQESITVLDLIKNFFRFYKNFNFSDHLIAPYLGVAITRNDFTNGTYKYPAYQAQLRIIGHALKREAEEIQIDCCLCVQDPFSLNHNIAKSIFPCNAEYMQWCLKNACSICDKFDEAKMTVTELYETLLYDLNHNTLKKQKCLNPKQNGDGDGEGEGEGKGKGKEGSGGGGDNVTLANNHLMIVLTPTRNNLRVLSQNIKDTTNTLQSWCLYYIEAIEIILTKLYRFDIQFRPEHNKKQKRDCHNNELGNKTWYISASIDLWTSRYHHKTPDQTFMEYQLAQTERLHSSRRQDSTFAVDLKAILSLNVAADYNKLELVLTQADGSSAKSLNKKHPLKRFINMFKCTLDNYNLKEAISTKTTQGI